MIWNPVSSLIQRITGGVSLVSGGARPGDDFPASGPLYLGVIKHGVLPSLRGGSATKRKHSEHWIKLRYDKCGYSTMATTLSILLSQNRGKNNHKTKIKTKNKYKYIRNKASVV